MAPTAKKPARRAPQAAVSGSKGGPQQKAGGRAKEPPQTKKKKAGPRSPSKSVGVVEPWGRRDATVLHTVSEVQARMLGARRQGLTIGFVPTMGALHAGHAALIDEARRRADLVVVSIFVNPKQFNDASDLDKYPRTLEADVELCRRCGADFVFAPAAADLYPAGFDTRVVAGALGRDLEGADRPGHFDGVLTVVALLFSVVQPHFAVFGEKDYQQLLLVQRLVTDLRLPVEVVAMPVIRDLDGLALSSRNARLHPADRGRATVLYRALMAAQDAVQTGDRRSASIEAAARAVFARDCPAAEIAYITVRDARSLLPVEELKDGVAARLLLAARLGTIRLIDNGPLFAGVRWRP